MLDDFFSKIDLFLNSIIPYFSNDGYAFQSYIFFYNLYNINLHKNIFMNLQEWLLYPSGTIANIPIFFKVGDKHWGCMDK